MRLILDADALIKLNRVGLLMTLVGTNDCFITAAVYDEVVHMGRARGYVDADPIARALERATHVTIEGASREAGFGRGELSILAALPSLAGSVVVTDDQHFRATLSRLQVPALTSADSIVLLVRQGRLKVAAGLLALENLKAFVREQAFARARTELIDIQEES